MRALNRQGKAPFAVSCAGHEGVQVGSALALRAGEDWVLPYYRDLGVMLVLGFTAREAMLQFLSRAADPCSGGRQMPGHWSSRRLKVLSGSSPVGTQPLHATGVALASKLKGEPHVSAVYFGEGSTAGGTSTRPSTRRSTASRCSSSARTTATPSPSPSAPRCPWRTSPTGPWPTTFPGQVVDGNDVLAVYEAMRVARARQGGGPTLLEAKTYRLVPHTSDDDDTVYRSGRRSRLEGARPARPLPRHPPRSRGADTGGGAGARPARRPRGGRGHRLRRAPLPDPSTLHRHVYAEPAVPTPSGVADVGLQRAA